MKTLLWCLMVGATLCSTTRALAQDQVGRFGVGVSLNPSTLIGDDLESLFLPIGLGDVFLPFIASERIKVEPQLGFLRFSTEITNGVSTAKETTTLWRLGAGVFYRLPASESLSAYVGPRFVLLLVSESSEFDGQEDDISQTHVSVGAALGGEYFFSSHFSLGGEFQLNYVSLGEPDDPDAPSTFDRDRSLVSNNGLILLRWYF